LVITAKIIFKLLHDSIQRRCQSKFHSGVKKVIYTIPSIYTSFQRSHLENYLKDAGFQEVEFIESASLIAAECSRQSSNNEKILILNWSPIQFEIAIGEIQKGKADVIDKIGRSTLGLIPLRRKISKLLSKKLQEKFPSLNITEAILPLLDDYGMKCLENLSIQQTTEIYISVANLRINTTLTVTKDEVEESCGYPFSTIEHMFSNFLEKELNITAICFKGLIIESINFKEKIKIKLNLIKTKEFFVLNFSSAIYEVIKGNVELVRRLTYSVHQSKIYDQVVTIFPRGTILPTETKEKNWRSTRHFSESSRFSCYEGERIAASQNFKFGEFTFYFDQAHVGLKDEFSVKRQYRLDKSGILSVFCRFKDGACQQTFKAPLARLKQEPNYDPKQILAEAKENEISDKKLIRDTCAK
jgi:molecular chaperone DnaK (HSP70)